MFATDSLGSSGGTPNGAIAGWRFIAPPGTAIVGLQDERYLGAYADNGWVPFVKGDGAVLETCTFTIAEEGCSVGEPFGSGSLNGILPVGEASTLTVGIKCVTPGGCTTGSTLHRAWAALYGAKVTLSTEAPPSIASPSGSLWGVGSAGGFHKGVEQVSFGTTDLTGVAKAMISVDGNALASQQGVCDYSQPLPCQPLNPVFQVDTARLTDGVHTIALDAYDAAGNERRLTEQISVANHPPPPPVSLTAVAQRDGSFVVSWSDPHDVIPIVSSTYELCPPSEIGCTNPTATGHNSPLSLPASAAGQIVIVWLTDAAGNTSPANTASVALTSTTSSNKGGNESPGRRRVARIRISHRLKGSRLVVTVRLPKESSRKVLLTLDAYHGKRWFARAIRRTLAREDVATVTFILPHRLRHATVLVVHARASGAMTGALAVHPGYGAQRH
jgi:hypothetical protein